MDVTEKMLRKDISKVKQRLCRKACKSGLYENFGQVEVRKIKDKYSDLDYSPLWELITKFDNWCMNFNDKQLEEYRREMK